MNPQVGLKMKAHTALVSALAQQVSAFHASKTPFRIYHGSTLSTRKSSRNRDTIIDVSLLNRVIEFDKTKKVVFVEPNVPMDSLVEATVAEGFLPKVVMELPNITVGGGFSGTSGESSSFRYGLFDSTISGIELILGNGEVIWAAADNDHRELFFATAGSCGSLGVVTLLEIELIDAKTFVELEYIPVESIEASVQVLRQYQQQDWVDYIDGILYSKDRGVIMIGRLTNEAIPGKIKRFDRRSDPWCYLHAEEVLERIKKQGSREGYKESIPVRSYLFRYDRGVFWSGLRAFNYFLTPFNRFTRYLLDPFMYSRTMVHALHRSGLASQAIIQDYAVPYDSTKAFIEWTDEKTGLWPLWLCPVKSATHDERSFSQGNNIVEDILLDVGIWGMGPKNSHEFIRLNRDFEAKVRELGGMKCLYAHAYYTEEEFWEVYDEKRYKEMRRKYQAESLPSVYEKVRVVLQGEGGEGGWNEWLRRQFWGIWPLGGLYGVASAAKGFVVKSDFLLKK